MTDYNVRVMHINGDRGTLLRSLPINWATFNCGNVSWDGGVVGFCGVNFLRPLGPVEDELRHAGDDWETSLSWEAWRCTLWAHHSCGGFGGVDALSEAIEAAEALGL